MTEQRFHDSMQVKECVLEAETFIGWKVSSHIQVAIAQRLVNIVTGMVAGFWYREADRQLETRLDAHNSSWHSNVSRIHHGSASV